VLRYLELHHWFAPRISIIASRQTATTVSWRILRLKGYQIVEANLTELRPLVRARDKKDVILAYLNVLISQARISGCTKGRGHPFGSSRGWLSSRLVHGGIFTLAPGTSRDDGDLLNEEVGERRRGDGRVKERARIVFARARVRESVSKNNGLQHPSPLRLDENVTQ